MFENSNCNLSKKTIKDSEGITYEFKYCIEMSSEEKNKLKEFREDYAKTSPIHFNFEGTNFQFSQKKYFKKNQFILDPPKLNELQNKFLNDIKNTLTQFNNFIQFERQENIEETKSISVKDILETELV
ncbi:MAG: hypothetical protein HYS24_15570 [Ignavibacteriales bacterium]|nr:hypothetical protein [Ignavibacteriales bacterium]MBK7979751.1 hypothetical protein [Ignavibacteriota bacterium]